MRSRPARGRRSPIFDDGLSVVPSSETGYDFAASHPAISAWLGRIAALPGWKSAYDMLPGQRLKHYA